MKKLATAVSFLMLLYACKGLKKEDNTEPVQSIISGTTWFDTDSVPVEFHAAGVLIMGDTYYCYGEDHALGAGNKRGVCCYSSKDLFHWKNEGIVLPKDSLPEAYRDNGVCERPKVIYNKKTNTYVMWMHLDAEGYTHSYAGVAVSDSATGTFRFLSAFRPVKYDYGFKIRNGCSPVVTAEDKERIKKMAEKEKGNTLRDMNLFADTDGKAYVIYSAEDNTTLYIVRLSDDYTKVEEPAVMGKTWIRAIPQGCREAPAVFKYKNKYYMFNSGLTGWAPNPAKYYVADSMLGTWTDMGNPCVGEGSNTTFMSQSTFVIPAPGKPEGCFIYMGDHWNGHELQKSTYIWLPFIIAPDGSIKLEYYDKWDMRAFDATADSIAKPEITEDSHNVSIGQKLLWKKIPNASVYRIYRNGVFIATTCQTEYEVPNIIFGKAHFTVVAANILNVNSDSSNSVTLSWAMTGPSFLSDYQADSWKQGFGSLKYDRSVDNAPLKIAGKEYKKGLGTHSASEVVYFIGGQFKKFIASVGIDDEVNKPKVSSAVFEVYGDDKLLFKSKLMKAGMPAEPVDVNIEKVIVLNLVVTEGGDSNDWDHADWADARIE